MSRSHIKHAFCVVFSSLMASALPQQQRHVLISPTKSTSTQRAQPQKHIRALPAFVLNGLNITSRERDVLRQLCAGQTSEQMAETLGVKATTIRTIIRSLFAKSHTSTRAALVWWWTTDRRGNSQQGKGKTGKKNIRGEKFEPLKRPAQSGVEQVQVKEMMRGSRKKNRVVSGS